MATESAISEGNEYRFGQVTKIFLGIAILFMALCEGEVIAGLLEGHFHSAQFARYLLPVLIPFPALYLILAQLQARRWVREGRMDTRIAARTVYFFAAATYFGYFCMLTLAEIAFSAR